MNHPHDLLSAYLDGELAPVDRVGVTGHLADCADCRGELDGLAGTRSAVRGLPVLQLPDGVIPAPEPIRLARRRGRVVAWAASAAAVGVVTVGVLAGGSSPAPAFDLDALVERHTARVVVDPGISTVRGPVGSP
jgi:anti-sigma factor RsiW